MLNFRPEYRRIGLDAKAILFLAAVFDYENYAKACGQGGRGLPFTATADDFERETALTQRELVTARKALREIGVLSEERKGLPARIYFTLNHDRLNELMRSATE